MSVVKELHAVDPDQAVNAVQPLKHYIEHSLAWRKSIVALLGVFGIAASGLAAVGIYGVMSYGVSQRSHEIGIRMALGAQPHSVLGIVISQGLRLVGIGVALGIAAAVAPTHLMSSLLFNVSAVDPLTFCRSDPFTDVRFAGRLLHSCAEGDACRSHGRAEVPIVLRTSDRQPFAKSDSWTLQDDRRASRDRWIAGENRLTSTDPPDAHLDYFRIADSAGTSSLLP
jgi:ABC-type antimicrobial peptide transport system permease subunit